MLCFIPDKDSRKSKRMLCSQKKNSYFRQKSLKHPPENAQVIRRAPEFKSIFKPYPSNLFTGQPLSSRAKVSIGPVCG